MQAFALEPKKTDRDEPVQDTSMLLATGFAPLFVQCSLVDDSVLS